MTKEDFIEILDKYDSEFNLETGETIQAIYFQDFGKLAEELVKLFAIPDVIEPNGKLKCECKDEWMEDVVYVQCSKCGEKY